MQGNRSNRGDSAWSRLRRSVAWLCLATTLAFAGLDALHQDRRGGEPTGALAHPCRICQLANSIHPWAGHAPPLSGRLERCERLTPPRPTQPRFAPLPLPLIRPPPTPLCWR